MSDLADQLARMASILAKIEAYQGVNIHGEAASWNGAYNLLEIKECCEQLLVFLGELDGLSDPGQAAERVDDIREHLRHLLYHVRDDSYLSTVL